MVSTSTNAHPNLAAILTSLHKRSFSSDCTYYETSCGTHRLAIMVIIICVGVLVTAILSTLYIRSHRNKNAKLRAIEQQRMRMKMNEGWPSSMVNSPTYVVPQGAPPPYEPRKPERVARVDEDWR
ncbi:hypothetical protein EK21DRAFT_99862 [Setomelanomma holmii]|uniref:Uncharacterized protein n=1 Tax=Setomelanomma holmii TaxID=210430 RepID=A0A9P4HAE9_9PLEO|nr:hypothetical protein EK21DRAFT_99862 [Setomelanomma holmii]